VKGGTGTSARVRRSAKATGQRKDQLRTRAGAASAWHDCAARESGGVVWCGVEEGARRRNRNPTDERTEGREGGRGE
jgi:hypothetical protein